MDAQTQPNEVRTQLLNLQHLAMPELTEKWKLLFHKKPWEEVETALRTLIDRAYCRYLPEQKVDGKAGRKPSRILEINPDLFS